MCDMIYLLLVSIARLCQPMCCETIGYNLMVFQLSNTTQIIYHYQIFANE